MTALAAASLVSALALGASSAAQADVSDGGAGGYGSWQLTGQSPAFSGTVELGGGFPQTTFTAASRTATLQTGASVFLPAGSPPGSKFGSSQGRGYINQRPVRDTLTGPGITTYTFATPTPSSAWGFVLGDIDADKAVVTAQDANGAPVPVADLGFQGVFNYCMPTDPPTTRSCSGDKVDNVWQFDLPTWDPATATLLGSGFGTNKDTIGASGWFMPRVPLSSLTITYTRLTGLPVYQTWFGTVARDISGTVSGCNVSGVAVELKDGSGKRVASTTTDSQGNYAFTNYLALDSYTVTATAAAGCALTGDTDQPVDISLKHATGVNFQQDVAPTPTATPSVSPSPDPTDDPTNDPTDEPTEEPTGTPTKSQTPGPSPATTPATTPATRPTQGSTTPAAGLATTGVAGATPALLVAGGLLAGGLALAGASRRRHKH
ncbi:SdrD B-like domain-containing protein [Arthrobacter sp. HY1533]|uniref:SdrD B-like domain-containing protein n=1 Tax=Arthrobacter sp. HY1533 TaxID=2970919 RepID=UPI0022B9FC56|nr:SdrD B-like domain-containing protein [Arthrobacter sp. HY1533]